MQPGMADTVSHQRRATHWISAGRTSVPYQGLPTNRHIQLTESDMQAIREQIPGVRFLSSETPVGSFRQSDTLVSYQRRSANFSVYGVADEYFDIKANVDFPGGRKLNPLDAEEIGRASCRE